MRRISIFIVIIIQILCIRNSYAQNFFSLPPGFNNAVRAIYYDDSSNTLYAGGNFSELGNGQIMYYVSQWNGSSWASLNYGLDQLVLAITKFQGEIYAGGSFSGDLTGNVYNPSLAKWNGSAWQQVCTIQGGSWGGPVWSLFVDNNNLYIGGAFDSINGIPASGLARFDGTNWYTYPSLGGFFYVNAIAVYNGELYIGGNFDAGFGKADIVKFDGSSWVSVGGGLSGGATIIDGMLVYQGELYVVGLFHTASGDPGNCIAKWNGTAWSSLGSGITMGAGQLFKIISFQNQVYVAGSFNSISGVQATSVARWDGSQWHNIGGVFSNGATALAENGNDLYIGGAFWTVNGDSMNFITRYSPPLEIEENTFGNSGITITPVPNNGCFIFSSLFYPIESIRLIDLSGRVIFSEDKILSNSYECKLNSPDGIYIAEVFVNGNAYRNKIIIAH
ncbi:MAG TPA: T9SS type A sorting domain-containing protein [Bacteroidia bacterium]|nr:T9SS type A sorting domain-containing protein [Bacteroidia bacterium]